MTQLLLDRLKIALDHYERFLTAEREKIGEGITK